MQTYLNIHMDTFGLNLQIKMANDTKGRFIPYIGRHYDKGLLTPSGYRRILIIGPRHYCDGVENSRNVLMGLNENNRDKLERGKRFPDEIRVGCTNTDASCCLKTKGGTDCPVYAGKECLLYNRCEIYKHLNIPCNGEHNRNLRCETLYAVDEFLNKPRIESARLGISYFGQITKFINALFMPVNPNAAYIWERVSFFNLIQRYIPLRNVNYDSSIIEKKFVQKQDVSTGEEIIKEIDADILIMTMPCIRRKMEFKLKSIGYKLLLEDTNYGYDVFCKKSIDTVLCKPDWQEEIDRQIADYELPENSWELREFIQQIIDKSRYKSKSKIRKYIFQIITNKIHETENISPSIISISCFQEHCVNPLESMREWLRYRSK